MSLWTPDIAAQEVAESRAHYENAMKLYANPLIAARARLIHSNRMGTPDTESTCTQCIFSAEYQLKQEGAL